MADSLATGARRVKVYLLTDDDSWDDRGTGHVRCEHDPRANTFMLRVIAEDSGQVSLCSEVRSLQDAFYQMQEDTIISWTEHALSGDNPSVTTEIALSFAEADGCREIWDRICHVDNLLKRQHVNKSATKQPVASSNLSSHSSPKQSAHSPPANADHPATSFSFPPTTAHRHGTSTAQDVLVGVTDLALPAQQSADNVSLHRGLHSSGTQSHLTLVDPSATADITHSSRFFDEPLDQPTSWNSDPIDDVIFRDTSSVLFLANSPGAMVPSHATPDAAIASGFAMPDPNRAGLEALSRVMSDQSSIGVQAIRERIISEISTRDYIPKLCRLFRWCEQSTDFQGLSLLYHIMRCFFIICNPSVLEILVNEKNLMDVVGCLEYDAENITILERRKADMVRASKEKTTFSKQCEMKVQREVERRSGEVSGPLEDRSGKEVSTGTCVDDDGSDRKIDISKVSLSREGDVATRTQPSDENRIVDKNCSDTGDVKERKDGEEDTGNSSPLRSSSIGDRKRATSDDSSHNVSRSSDVVEKTRVSCKTERQGPHNKNLSEETTSSGNIKGEISAPVLREHRDFLEGQASFTSVVPIEDPSVLAKIHQNYRVGYIRDVILSGLFDETVSGALSGVIVCNNVDIIMYFIASDSALQQLLSRLQQTVRVWQELQDQCDRPSVMNSGGMQYRDCSGRAVQEKEDPNDEMMIGREGRPTSDPARSPERDREQVLISNTDRDVACTTGGAGKSYVSTGTGTTGETHATGPCEPSTSKEVSSVETAKRGKSRLDSLEETRRELHSMLGFLRELSSLVKSQQPAVKNRFHTLMTDLGALEITAGLLLDRDQGIRSLSSEILSAAVLHDQTEVRAHILKSVIEKEREKPKRMGVSLRSAVAPQTIVPNRAADTPRDRQEPVQRLACSGAQVTDTNGKKSEKSATTGLQTDDIHNATRCGGEASRTAGPPIGSSTVTRFPSVASSLGVERVLAGKSLADAVARPCEAHGMGSRADSRAADSVIVSNEDHDTAVQNDVLPRCHLGMPDGEKDVGPVLVDDVANFPLLSSMVDVICRGKGSGFVLTVLDLLRVLLDPLSMRVQTDRELFLDVFYEKFVARLLVPIVQCYENERRRAEQGLPCTSDENVNFICDLISYCVGSHTYRSKYFVLGFDVGGKIAKLLAHRKGHIKLAGLRFLRASIGLRDDMFDRYIIREKLLEPVMTMFKHNEYRDNLINSAVLSLVHYIATEKRFQLLKHLLSKYTEILEPTLSYCRSFGEAKKVFEEMKASGEGGHAAAGEDDRMTASNGTTDKGVDVTLSGVQTLSDAAGLSDHGRMATLGSLDGSSMRLVPSLLGQDVRISQDLEEDKFLSRTGEEEQALEELQSFINGSHVGGVQQFNDQLNPSRAEMVGCWTDSKSDGNRVQSTETAHVLDGKASADLVNVRTGGNVDRTTATTGKERQCSQNVGRTGRPGDGERDSNTPDRQGPGASGIRKPLVGYPTGDSDEDDEPNREPLSAGVGRAPAVARDRDGEGPVFGGMRLSLSKSDICGRDISGGSDGDVGDLVCESSEDSGSPRKRERSVVLGRRGWMADGGIETCTQAVMEMQKVAGGADAEEAVIEESPPKRRRTDDSDEEGDACNDEGRKESGWTRGRRKRKHGVCSEGLGKSDLESTHSSDERVTTDNSAKNKKIDQAKAVCGDTASEQ